MAPVMTTGLEDLTVKLKEVGSLLHGARAVGEDNAVNVRFFPKDPVDSAGNERPVFWPDIAARLAHQVLEAHVCDEARLRNALQRLTRQGYGAPFRDSW